jgi:DNA-binding response OmpR family regulator
VGTVEKRKKIVVLDDSDLIRALVKESLEESGFEVIDLDTPLGFSNLLRRERPDLALVDVTMPTLSGDKLAEIAIRLGVGCPIVLFSDRPATELAALVQSTRANGFIKKTGDMGELVRQVNQFLKHP